MNWIVMLLGGLLTGAIAKALLREKHYGLILTTFVGLVGGLLGGWLAKQFGWITDRWLESFAASVFGAILFLGFLRFLRGGEK